MVGTFGNCGALCGVVTAMGTSLPAVMCGSEEATLSIISFTLPESRSAIAGPLPR